MCAFGDTETSRNSIKLTPFPKGSFGGSKRHECVKQRRSPPVKGFSPVSWVQVYIIVLSGSKTDQLRTSNDGLLQRVCNRGSWKTVSEKE